MEMVVTKFSNGKYRNEGDLFAEPISADAVFGEAIYLQIAHRNLLSARVLAIFLYRIAIIVVIYCQKIYKYLLLLSLSKPIDMRKGVTLCHAELSFQKALLLQTVDQNFDKAQALTIISF